MHDVSYDCSFRWLYLSVGYTYTYHPILETFELDSYKGEHRIKVIPQNLNHNARLQVDCQCCSTLWFLCLGICWATSKNFITLPASKGGSAYSISKPFVILALNNGFTFPGQWVLNLDYSYNGAGSSGYIEYSSSSSLNCSIQNNSLISAYK